MRVPLSIAYRDLRELERLRAAVDAVDPSSPAAKDRLLELDAKVEEIRSRRARYAQLHETTLPES